jgi:polyhydroxyalkanoic acid synthase PhaR subunit
MWSGAKKSDKMAEIDWPNGGHLWVELAHAMQKCMTNNVHALFDPQEAWKLWFDATMDMWRLTIKMGGDPFGVIASGVKAMEQMQVRPATGEYAAFDPFAFFNKWYDATSKPWASMVEELIASKPFLAFTGPFLENYSHLTSTFRDASEAYFKTLRLPTLSDIARVAELIVSLEEKIDDVAETIEYVKEQSTWEATPMSRITDMEQQLSQIESRLDNMLALLKKGEARPKESTSAASRSIDEEQTRDKEAGESGGSSKNTHSLVEADPFASNDA